MCHHRQPRYERVATPAPSPTPSGPVRVGDADRERVAELLRGHAAAGRIDTNELEERLERAYAARYGSDLEPVLAELPPQPAPRARSPRERRSPTPSPILAIAAIGVLIALAAITSAWWLMWLIWPIVMVLGPHRRYRRTSF
jgi:Domain of unknown function (DUF1707)